MVRSIDKQIDKNVDKNAFINIEKNIIPEVTESNSSISSQSLQDLINSLEPLIN
jgi:hypothetical protein